MVEATPEYLLNVVDEETALKIWTSLEGMRLYFAKNTIRNYHINKDYKRLRTNYYTNIQAIRELSYKYEISEDQLRRITKKAMRPLSIE